MSGLQHLLWDGFLNLITTQWPSYAMSSNITATLVPKPFTPLALLPPPLGGQIRTLTYICLAVLLVSLD
jgi:hypothetical protein